MPMKTIPYRGLIATALTFAVLPSAQAVVEEFQGGFRSDLPWTWEMPGSTPLNTFNAGTCSFGSSSIDMNFGDFMWQEYNSPKNILSMPIVDSNGNWEISVDLNPRFSQLNEAANPYGSTGVVFAYDCDNYVMFYIGRNGALAGLNFAFEQYGTWYFGYSPSAEAWSDSDVYTLKLSRIISEGNTEPQIDVFVYKNGAPFGPQGGYQMSLGPWAPGWVYDFMKDLSGKRVGLFVDAAGNNDLSGAARSVSFLRVQTNMKTPGVTRIGGTATLQDLDSSYGKTGIPLDCKLYQGSNLIESETVGLDKDGKYVISTAAPAGSYQLYVKTGTWLTKKANVTIGSGDVTVDISLINGDVDGDDTVTVFDYNVLSDSFDKAFGEEGFDYRADLDRDGLVTVFDYNILSGSFDLSGDAP